jgi:hypothetical protein
MTTDNFCVYLQDRLIQTIQTGGQQYSDTSPFSIPAWTFLYSSNGQTSVNRTNLGRVFNSRSGCMYVMNLCCYEAKQPNLNLKTQPKQLLGYCPLAFVLPTPATIVRCPNEGSVR